MENLFFISGLPRTGSTLLSALLSQNPDVYAGGNSAVCQLMWDAQQSCQTAAYEQLAATDKFELIQKRLCSEIPKMYYKGINKKYVFDKCRSWTLPANVQLIQDYINSAPKIVVLVRPIDSILKSFLKLHKDNNKTDVEPNDLLTEWSEPVMRSYNGVMHAKTANEGQFLFVDYDRLVDNPEEQLARIYTFVGIKPFSHDFYNIAPIEKENDTVYGLKGMHEVRETISGVENTLQLPPSVKEQCARLTAELYNGLSV